MLICGNTDVKKEYEERMATSIEANYRNFFHQSRKPAGEAVELLANEEIKIGRLQGS